MSRSSIRHALREAVFRRDAGRCQYCHLAQLGHGATFHIDHIIPRSRSGLTSLDNLALQCPNCSLRKANKTTAIDPQNGQPIALFHPLLQAWREHFRLRDMRRNYAGGHGHCGRAADERDDSSVRTSMSARSRVAGRELNRSVKGRTVAARRCYTRYSACFNEAQSLSSAVVTRSYAASCGLRSAVD